MFSVLLSFITCVNDYIKLTSSLAQQFVPRTLNKDADSIAVMTNLRNKVFYINSHLSVLGGGITILDIHFRITPNSLRINFEMGDAVFLDTSTFNRGE